LPGIIDHNGATTFAEVDVRAAILSRGLLAAGVGKGAHVGILMGNGRDFMVALFAVMRIGAIAVLISTLARPRELAHMIRNADLDVLLSADAYLSNDYVARLEEALPSLHGADASRRLSVIEAPFLRAIWIWGKARPSWTQGGEDALGVLAANISFEITHTAEAEVVPSDPALIIYTSGSSAEPKAIVHSHGSVVRQGRALSTFIDCKPGDRLLTTLPFFWVGGLCTTILGAICSGAAALCPDNPSPDATIACIRKWNATHIFQWPAQLALMKDNPEFQAALTKMRPAYSVQFSIFGWTPAELTPNSLGMTETLGPHSFYPMEALPPERAGSYGIAVGGIERRIIDPDTGKEQPPGTPGILALRGGAVLMGMHRKSYHEVFDDQGFYRTEDICKITEDGHLYFISRRDDLVKISGANVSPTEVESVIRGEPGIKGACVVGLPGDKGETLAAAVVLEEGAKVAVGDLTARLKAQLSSYKVPRDIVFLREDEIPMTATAKVYRPALKQLLSARLGR
jgi:acyl-coenzyme A synthetase/AMP-(fatty) acid ligase